MNFNIIPYTLTLSLLFGAAIIPQPASANQPKPKAEAQAKPAPVKSVWSVFSSQEGGFKILMPGTPQETKQKVKSKNGEVEVNLFTVERPQEDVKYTVAYIDYPEAYISMLNDKNLLEQAIDTGKNTALKNANGTVISEETIKLGDYSGKEINYTKPGDKIVKHRIFLVGKRLYQISAETTKQRQKYLTKSISGFCDSFTLLPK
jgi:hypothetical protein